MGFRRFNRDRSRIFPPNPRNVNSSPRSRNVLQPRSTIRKRIMDPLDDGEADVLFVYEFSNPSEQATQYQASKIKPSNSRAQHDPGVQADRPDLDSFWSYLYHSVFFDPCCGDMERVFYRANIQVFEEEMVFFNKEAKADGESNTDGCATLNGSSASYLEEEEEDAEQHQRQLQGKEASSPARTPSRAGRHKAFVNVRRFFPLRATAAEI